MTLTGSFLSRTGPGSAAQSGSEMNRSGSLRTYLIMEYGEQTQRLVKDYGNVFQAVVYGTVFSTIPAGLPGPGLYHLVTVLPFHIC